MNWIEKFMQKNSFYFIRKNTRKDPSSDELHLLETTIGFPLPKDYRYFVASYGWTSFELTPAAHPIDKYPGSREVEINMFFGFSNNPADDLITIFQDAPAELKSQKLLKIGDDPGGNFFLIGMDGKDAGKVFFWDHEYLEFQENFDDVVKTIEMHGIDTKTLDMHQIVEAWKKVGGKKAASLKNIYLVAENFKAFLENLNFS